MGCEVKKPGLRSGPDYLPVVWPWPNHSTFLHLSLLIHKRGLIQVTDSVNIYGMQCAQHYSRCWEIWVQAAQSNFEREPSLRDGVSFCLPPAPATMLRPRWGYLGHWSLRCFPPNACEELDLHQGQRLSRLLLPHPLLSSLGVAPNKSFAYLILS